MPASPVISNPSSFWHEARAQRVCAACGAVGPFHAHHVVDKQTLTRQGLKRNDLYDTRNALRLCEGLMTKRCHFRHENLAMPGRQRGVVRTDELLDDNIEYAWQVLGPYAVAYLRREYDDDAGDPRIAELELRCE